MKKVKSTKDKKDIKKEVNIKKENTLKVILCSIAAILVIGALILKGFGSDSVTDNVLKDLNADLVSLNKYVNKYNIPLKGTTKMRANYKGAHGESFPRDFKFNYELEGNILYFSNEEGYTKLELDQRLVSLYNMFKKDIKENILKVKEEKKDGNSINVTLDIDLINKHFDTEFKKCEVTINKKNAMSSEIKDITIVLDDYIITIDGNKYKIMYNDNKIDISVVKTGYSLAINDNVKMNVIYEDSVDKYNIIVDNYVYSLSISDNNVKFTPNSRASIYNSIETSFTGENVSVDKSKESDIKNNPLTRYFAEKE